jgi:hypothetical protein
MEIFENIICGLFLFSIIFYAFYVWKVEKLNKVKNNQKTELQTVSISNTNAYEVRYLSESGRVLTINVDISALQENVRHAVAVGKLISVKLLTEDELRNL